MMYITYSCYETYTSNFYYTRRQIEIVLLNSIVVDCCVVCFGKEPGSKSREAIHPTPLTG